MTCTCSSERRPRLCDEYRLPLRQDQDTELARAAGEITEQRDRVYRRYPSFTL
jgi:hypothetical protein